jgi:NADPH:quinone reductase-like Zn-dependent oxidoreductase
MINRTVPPKMQAVRLHPPGGVDNISLDQVTTPTPRPGEVLVRVHAAAITRDELSWPANRLPAIPSYELSGTVAAVGQGGDGFEPGQDVYGMTSFDRDGVAAEYAAVKTGELHPKPNTLSHVESAAIPLPALSAMQGLFDHGRLAKNERVLIHGGAGGVGAFAVQLARHHGAYVIATASGERATLARELGADEVIDHAVTDFTDLDPVDLVFDTVGGYRLKDSVEVLEEGGRLISVAEEPPRAEAGSRGIDAAWFLVQTNQDQLGELARLADAGALQTHVGRTFPLIDARDAFTHTQDQGGAGKVVLVGVEEA